MEVFYKWSYRDVSEENVGVFEIDDDDTIGRECLDF